MVQRFLDSIQSITDDFHLPLLVVEDDQGLNRLIRKNLIREGFTVEVVGTGKEALAALKDAPDVLFLLDLVLPDMTGREILAERARRETVVPFIIMTGHGDERFAVEMMKLGARDYIVKGTQFIELLPRIITRVCSEIGKERKLVALGVALAQATRTGGAPLTLSLILFRSMIWKEGLSG